MYFPRKVSLLPSLFALLFVAAAAQAQPVSSELTIARVVAQPDGSQRLAPAPEVGPGDLLQYTATYRNTSQRAVRRLAATLPIPPGTEYVAAPAVSGVIEASVGGTVFEPVPLMRKVKRPDGQVALVAVPLAEYRALRWPERDLAAGSSIVASARVRVSAPEANPQLAQPARAALSAAPTTLTTVTASASR